VFVGREGKTEIAIRGDGLLRSFKEDLMDGRHKRRQQTCKVVQVTKYRMPRYLNDQLQRFPEDCNMLLKAANM
jgi:hypothetical protein